MIDKIFELSIADKIKRILQYRGMQISQLSVEFNRRYGTSYSPNSFRNKLNNGALSFDDVEKIGAILNFTVEIKIKD
ncbi:MAG: hypothetical protein IJU91_05705 [Selenomonadaceae bacterium]|nr:hypothetical protein [Selenomonadaceae bacterium]